MFHSMGHMEPHRLVRKSHQCSVFSNNAELKSATYLVYQTTNAASSTFVNLFMLQRPSLYLCAQEFRGFGFVTFRSPFAAEDAAEDANGTEVLGGRVKVNIANYKGTLRPAYRDERCANQPVLFTAGHSCSSI